MFALCIAIESKCKMHGRSPGPSCEFTHTIQMIRMNHVAQYGAPPPAYRRCTWPHNHGERPMDVFVDRYKNKVFVKYVHATRPFGHEAVRFLSRMNMKGSATPRRTPYRQVEACLISLFCSTNPVSFKHFRKKQTTEYMSL